MTIEDSAELQLQQPHVVRLETRPANIEGKGRIAARDLVHNSLRMRPERIIVGEVRGDEALDMLQAMNTGHDGSLTTVHANTPRDALSRIENMVSMTGISFPIKTLRAQIASAINVVIQVERHEDGKRRIVSLRRDQRHGRRHHHHVRTVRVRAPRHRRGRQCSGRAQTHWYRPRLPSRPCGERHQHSHRGLRSLGRSRLMFGDGALIFIGLVFAAVFLLAQGLVVPVFGESRVMAKRLKQRLRQIDKEEGESITSLLREKSLRELSPLERRLESLPWMESLSARIAQSGNNILAYRLVLRSLLLMIAAGFLQLAVFPLSGADRGAHRGGCGAAVLEDIQRSAQTLCQIRRAAARRHRRDAAGAESRTPVQRHAEARRRRHGATHRERIRTDVRGHQLWQRCPTRHAGAAADGYRASR